MTFARPSAVEGQPSIIGTRLPRLEDGRLLDGSARFIDDLAPDSLRAVVVRSNHSHARIISLDVEEARAAPGVQLVLTHADLVAAELGRIPLDMSPLGEQRIPLSDREQPALAAGEVRYVGEPVALIVADSVAEASAAAELIAADYEPLPAVTRLADPEAPVVLEREEGDGAGVEEAFARAHRVVSVDLSNNRVHALPVETRGCIGEHFSDRGEFSLAVGTQRVHLIQRALADNVFRVPREKVRVYAPDVGGGFGQKNGLYPEYVLCLEAARRLGKPVKWIAERFESFISDNHGRDNLFHVQAALDNRGRILGIKARRDLNLGAYAAPRGLVPVLNGLSHLTGVYQVEAAHVTVRALMTNTASTSPYRGAGRPENVFACERLLDVIARKLQEDPVEIRRRNLVNPRQMPWLSPLGTRFDDMDPGAVLDEALARIGHAGFPQRRAASEAKGLKRGIGVCLFAEDLHGSSEPVPVRLSYGDARLTVCVGTGSTGHGHETAFLQVLASRLCLPIEKFCFVQSDTNSLANGIGTAASWSMTLGGSSVRVAADAAVKRGAEVAASKFGVPSESVLFDDGKFRLKNTNHVLEWEEVFAADPAFAVETAFEGRGASVSVGCHACEVEVDPETGEVGVQRYVVAQDCGQAVNPMLIEGQLHGGAAQGIGQGWMEAIIYDDAGQILSASLMDYAVPRAKDLPEIATALFSYPEIGNPLGTKGIGESAATGASAAFVNSVLDALSPLGVQEVAPPLTPERVWRAIQNAAGIPL